MQQTQAKLNGTVNPNESDTHYYFQYGTTTSYGSSTASTDAGSGVSSVPASITVTGLVPSLTYHYRLVASNSAGTSYGSDQTLWTLDDETSARWTVREPINNPNGDIWAGYRNTAGALSEEYYLGTEWLSKELSVQIASGTSPSAVREPGINNPNGDMWLFYQSATGHLSSRYYLGTEWLTKEFNGQMATGTSPNVVREPTTNPNASIWVFYQSATGHLADTYYLGTEWLTKEESSVSMASGTSPSVVREPGIGNPNASIWVFYQSATGHLAERYYTGTEWLTREFGVQMAAGTSPSVVRDPNTGKTYVFYHGSNGQIAEVYGLGAEWSSKELGVQMAAGTSPSVVREPTNNPNGNIWVFYQGTNGKLAERYYLGTEWLTKELGGAMASGASPSAVREPVSNNPNGSMWVFYKGVNGRLDTTYFVTTVWTYKELKGQMG